MRKIFIYQDCWTDEIVIHAEFNQIVLSVKEFKKLYRTMTKVIKELK